MNTAAVPRGRKQEKQETPDIKPEPGTYRVILIKNDRFAHRVFKHFLYLVNRVIKRKDPGQFKWGSFIYICSPLDIPGDIKPADLARFMARVLKRSKQEITSLFNKKYLKTGKNKRFYKLQPRLKGAILIEIINLLVVKGKNGLFLVNNIAPGMYLEFSIKLKEWMETIAAKGGAVVYLTTDPIVSDSTCEDDSDYDELPEWTSQVDKIKAII